MEKLSLAGLTAAAGASDGPGFPPPNAVKFGGVDPLGLRQLNFNLMDEVLPGLNNVARGISVPSLSLPGHGDAPSSLRSRAGWRRSRPTICRILLTASRSSMPGQSY
jgi:hypothetical protein